MKKSTLTKTLCALAVCGYVTVSAVLPGFVVVPVPAGRDMPKQETVSPPPSPITFTPFCVVGDKIKRH